MRLCGLVPSATLTARAAVPPVLPSFSYSFLAAALLICPDRTGRADGHQFLTGTEPAPVQNRADGLRRRLVRDQWRG